MAVLWLSTSPGDSCGSLQDNRRRQGWIQHQVLLREGTTVKMGCYRCGKGYKSWEKSEPRLCHGRPARLGGKDRGSLIHAPNRMAPCKQQDYTNEDEREAEP